MSRMMSSHPMYQSQRVPVVRTGIATNLPQTPTLPKAPPVNSFAGQAMVSNAGQTAYLQNINNGGNPIPLSQPVAPTGFKPIGPTTGGSAMGGSVMPMTKPTTSWGSVPMGTARAVLPDGRVVEKQFTAYQETPEARTARLQASGVAQNVREDLGHGITPEGRVQINQATAAAQQQQQLAQQAMNNKTTEANAKMEGAKGYRAAGEGKAKESEAKAAETNMLAPARAKEITAHAGQLEQLAAALKTKAPAEAARIQALADAAKGWTANLPEEQETKREKIASDERSKTEKNAADIKIAEMKSKGQIKVAPNGNIITPDGKVYADAEKYMEANPNGASGRLPSTPEGQTQINGDGKNTVIGKPAIPATPATPTAPSPTVIGGVQAAQGLGQGIANAMQPAVNPIAAATGTATNAYNASAANAAFPMPGSQGTAAQIAARGNARVPAGGKIQPDGSMILNGQRYIAKADRWSPA